MGKRACLNKQNPDIVKVNSAGPQLKSRVSQLAFAVSSLLLTQRNLHNRLSATLNNSHFQVVSRYREPQLEVGKLCFLLNKQYADETKFYPLRVVARGSEAQPEVGEICFLLNKQFVD